MKRSTPSLDHRLFAIALASTLVGVLGVFLTASFTGGSPPPGIATEDVGHGQTGSIESMLQSLVRSPSDNGVINSRIGQCAGSKRRTENRRRVRHLLEDAQIRPAYRRGQIRGFQITKVTDDSFWQAIGIDSGDVVIEFAGTPIENSGGRMDMVEYLANSPRGKLTIRKADGGNRPIYWDTPESDAYPDGAVTSSCGKVGTREFVH